VPGWGDTKSIQRQNAGIADHGARRWRDGGGMEGGGGHRGAGPVRPRMKNNPLPIKPKKDCGGMQAKKKWGDLDSFRRR